MILNPENIKDLSTSELQEIVWDIYKSDTGCRPRHLTTREQYLAYLAIELHPDLVEIRKAEQAEEDLYIQSLEDDEYEDVNVLMGFSDDNYDRYDRYA